MLKQKYEILFSTATEEAYASQVKCSTQFLSKKIYFLDIKFNILNFSSFNLHI